MDIQFERDIVGWVQDARHLRLMQAYRSPVIQAGATFCMATAAPAPGLGPVMRNLKGVTTLMRDLIVDDPARDPGAARATRGRSWLRAPRATGERAATTRKRSREQWGHTIDTAAFPRPEFSRATAGVAGLAPMLGLRGPGRGTLIHTQIEDSVLHDAEHFARRHAHGMHPWARSLLGALLQRGLRPFKAEFIVHDADMRCATRIDLVAVDRTGRLHFIENKTGYANGKWHDVRGAAQAAREGTGARWRPDYLNALAFFPCTARNQAAVQAVLGARMAARMLRLPPETYSVAVARVSDDGVDYVPVADTFVKDVGSQLDATLASARRRPALPPGTARQQ